MNKYKNYFIKLKNEPDKFLLRNGFGIKVIEIENPDKVDGTIEKIIKNSKSESRFFISNDLASFSSDIYMKYKKKKSIRIIIL